MQKAINYKSVLAKCVAVFLLGFILSSLLTATAYATSVYGSYYYFSDDGKNYYNYASLTNESTTFTGRGNIVCVATTLPAGYLGGRATVYYEPADGSTPYHLIWGEWEHSPTATSGFAGKAIVHSEAVPGSYFCQGQTTYYKNGSYTTPIYTYSSPKIDA